MKKIGVIKNIRYGPLGLIRFEIDGVTRDIPEPRDVILVGTDPRLAANWIIDTYGLFIGGYIRVAR